MNFSKLRHRITLQERVASKDSFGAEMETWKDISTVWAMVEPLSGREYFAAQQVNAEVTTKVTIRYIKSIKPEMRVVFEDRVFDILSVICVDERKVEMQLMCKENV